MKTITLLFFVFLIIEMISCKDDDGDNQVEYNSQDEVGFKNYEVYFYSKQVLNDIRFL